MTEQWRRKRGRVAHNATYEDHARCSRWYYSKCDKTRQTGKKLNGSAFMITRTLVFVNEKWEIVFTTLLKRLTPRTI